MRDENTYCKNCHALIIFIRTEAGKNMPCDVNPVAYRVDPDGESRIFTKSGKLIRCDLNCTKEDFDGFGYMPHWKNCISRDGRERLEGYKQQTKKNARPAPSAPPPKPRKIIEDEPKVEQMCLFGNSDRPYRHPI